MNRFETRLLSTLQNIVGDAGVVLHVVTFSDNDPTHWSAYFSTEFAALRAYHKYGGGTYFGTRRIQKVTGGQFPGSFSLTNHPGEVSK